LYQSNAGGQNVISILDDVEIRSTAEYWLWSTRWQSQSAPTALPLKKKTGQPKLPGMKAKGVKNKSNHYAELGIMRIVPCN
jgi:hypothetical protein